MRIIAGLSLKNLKPRVWDKESPYFLPALEAVMLSYAEFYQWPSREKSAKELGLHGLLGIPNNVKIYLDNGSFYFRERDGEMIHDRYESFVSCARPDWYPVPRDFIPLPSMKLEEQRKCLEKTMACNLSHVWNGFVPILHISAVIDEYLTAFQIDPGLRDAHDVGLGGIVPNLLRTSKSPPYLEILSSVIRVRRALRTSRIHLFGVGGTATLHLAALLGMDSVDSSGWRNRAARGVIQLPGCGDRMVADLGSWRGREPNSSEWKRLAQCSCPACATFGLDGLKARGVFGFSNRATHNLWTILEEDQLIRHHLSSGTYKEWFAEHLDNTIYLPIIWKLMEIMSDERLRPVVAVSKINPGNQK